MNTHLPKIIAIVGPTASGKSDLAVDIACSFRGEVVSADSRQVYMGMDIGTGKITKEEMRGIPHHLLDIAIPMETISAGSYKALADTTIRGIKERGNIPILCGGTGFYLDAVIEGFVLPDVPPDPSLRAALSQKSAAELFVMLQKEDPTRAETIDPKNPHRLIRALEIVRALGAVPKRKAIPPYETLMIGISVSGGVLRERIHKRLLARMDTGMVSEAERLHAEGVSWERMEELGLEYRYLSRHLRGLVTEDAMLRELETEITHYAKRQMTWFRKNPKIHWIELGETAEALALTKEFLHSDT